MPHYVCRFVAEKSEGDVYEFDADADDEALVLALEWFKQRSAVSDSRIWDVNIARTASATSDN